MTTSADDDECAPALLRVDLPAHLERWHEMLAPGTERASSAAEWSGALILVSSGVLEVICAFDGRSTFVAGDVLALSCLPLRSIRNPGSEPVVITAVRRRRG